jgi:DNA-directed RNA polymerase subunit beta'
LRGLKENVIIGHLIPAGTGMRVYQNMKLFDENKEDLDVTINRILEEKKKEEEEMEAEPAIDDTGVTVN